VRQAKNAAMIASHVMKSDFDAAIGDANFAMPSGAWRSAAM
jgi:hypothetical protein